MNRLEKTIRVRSANGAYEVYCGRGVLKRLPRVIETLGNKDAVFAISSSRIWRHWGARVEKILGGSRRATILMDDRETAKNLFTVERACRELVRAGADRRALLVAVGGGVVGDVAGYVAASYARGIGLIHVPTTLVAQVDSAIGGKTGVNLPEGKNLVGAFYPPQLVLADPATLLSLPLREYRSGLYEVIKYGVIGDAQLFAFLEKNIERVVKREARALDFVIPRCIRAKASVVSRDEKESGLREILNYGHTFAHALETATGYRRYLHGEAVGWGMIAAARLAQGVGMLKEDAADRIETLVRLTGPLPALPQGDPAQLVEIMGSDKKTRGGKLRFVLPHRIGRVETVGGLPVNRVWQVLADLQTADARRAAPRRG